MNMNGLAVSAATIVAMAPAVTAAESRGAVDTAALQAIVEDWMTDVDIDLVTPQREYTFGATVSIRIPGQEDIHIAAGVDDRTITTTTPDGRTVEHTETPMPTDGVFHVDRVARTFVAAVTWQLVDEGLLSLDDPIGQWLPDGPEGITIRMLLGHTSGLGEWNASPTMVSTILEDLERHFSPDEVWSFHVAAPPLGEPGGPWVFSRADTVALALIAQQVLGQDLEAILDERIIGPLGLDDTSLNDGPGVEHGTLHAWFSLSGDTTQPTDGLDYPQESPWTSQWPGSMLSTSADLLDWTEALYSGQVVSAESTAQMTTMHSDAWNESPFVYYGLGASGYCLDIDGCAEDGVDFVGQAGNFPGTATRIAYHRDSGASIVVHLNVSPLDAVPFVELAGSLLAELGVI